MKEDLNIDREVLFFRYSSGIATSEEKELVDKLIADSENTYKELKAVQSVVDIKKRIREIETYNISGGYEKVRRGIRETDRKRKFVSILSRVAAILAFPLLISTFTLGYIAFNKEQETEIIYTEVISAPGLVSYLQLPDKSKVWLNSNSKLRYPNRFTNTIREVELEGEGYFEVESDKEHPFYVTTASDVKVMAYGTRFNINTDEHKIETILAEGKVAVFQLDNFLTELKPGEQGSFDKESAILDISEISLLEKLAWKDGKIIFRNAPLDEVFRQLSKRYNVDIILHDEHNQSGKYLSRVTFTDETIQQIFSYLEIAAPIEWKLSTPVQNNDSTLVKQRIDVWLKKR